MLLLYTTFETKEEAAAVTRQLIEEGLIACANLLEIDSIYRWEGEVIEDDEVLALCKLPEENRDAVRDRLVEVHPYEVPCIVFYESLDALDAYADWVGGE